MSSHGVAFITGASQGIGKAIALRLAADGFDIALNDIPAGKEKLDVLSQEIIQKGRKCGVFLGDVSVEADVENMINAAAGSLGRLDVVSLHICITHACLTRKCRWSPTLVFAPPSRSLKVHTYACHESAID
jgi:NAD(P)-dependent dehydrogenase (short-subunit alcohol dehydrogenase family)